jgi:glyoxylase-like metal-dependent hydrolase (beta-lactamase superfamily II)
LAPQSASAPQAAPQAAGQQAASAPPAAAPLKQGSYWIEGGSCNTAFLIGPKGVLILDAQKDIPDAGAALAEIAKLTPKPVEAIIVSHSDPGNVGGLPAYPAGTPIIAQENVGSTIQAVNAGTDKQYPAALAPIYRALADFPPTRTVGGTETITLDGFKLVLIHVAPAHTSSDLVVYVPAQRWVFAGDVITTNTGPYPVIHRSGSSIGWIATMQALLALDADTYVPGHGPIESKTLLRSRLKAAEERREQIKVLVEEHKSLEEIKQALPEPTADPRFTTFAQTVYEELTRGYPRS